MHVSARTEDAGLLRAILDSMSDPVLVADVDHRIVFMNRAAVGYYSEGASLLGTNLLNCHNEESNRIILEVLEALRSGEDERLITDSDDRRIFMRAVRGPDGSLIGYYERYAAPVRSDGG
ncbi:PAS domain-containing protein [bacterium]|nr:PAS domain-containing protein [bacterium]